MSNNVVEGNGSSDPRALANEIVEGVLALGDVGYVVKELMTGIRWACKFHDDDYVLRCGANLHDNHRYLSWLLSKNHESLMSILRGTPTLTLFIADEGELVRRLRYEIQVLYWANLEEWVELHGEKHVEKITGETLTNLMKVLQ